MFSEIRGFLNQFFQAELDAHNARRYPDLEAYNKKLDFMNSFCVEELHNTFGMIKATRLRKPEEYVEAQKYTSTNPRHIFKISHYQNERYGDVFVAYVSPPYPSSNRFKLFTALFIGKIDGDWKIMKKYIFAPDDYIPPIDIPHWNDELNLKEDENLNFKNVGRLIFIERYLEPVDSDEWELKEYYKDI
ncbi:MAG: hypothetical protein MUC49_06590 [Raineya sp.]|jgi:hypothetical protein|nr:hypothetical protein [Raineya sp.]